MPDINPGPAVTYTANSLAQQQTINTTGTQLYANLPPASSVPVGYQAYTTDQGPVYSNGTSWVVIGSEAGTAIDALPAGNTAAVLTDVMPYEHDPTNTKSTYQLSLQQLLALGPVKPAVNYVDNSAGSGGAVYTGTYTPGSPPTGTTGTDGSGTLTTGQVILITAATNAAGNGPWVVNSAGNWSRPSWYATGSTGVAYYGTVIQSLGGTNLTGTSWYISSPTTGSGTVTIDTNNVTWSKVNYSAGTVAGAGGSNTQIQYNNSGTIAGTSNLVYSTSYSAYSDSILLSTGGRTAFIGPSTGSATSAGANLNIAAGNGGSTSGAAGNMTISAGTSTAAGGNTLVNAGNGTGNSSGGTVYLQAGNGGSTGGYGGAVSLKREVEQILGPLKFLTAQLLVLEQDQHPKAEI